MKIKPINLSPSFLGDVYSKGYDYAVGKKLGLIEKDTKSMSQGRLFHSLIANQLGHGTQDWVINPYDSFRTNEAKNWRDSQPDNIAIVTEDEITCLTDIAKRAINHPQIKPLLVNPEVEQTIEQEVGGYNIKGILDISSEARGGIVLDWKFISTENFDKFTKKALWLNYDLQAAVYDYLRKPTHVYFGVVENQAPFRIKLFWCDKSFLASGADKFNKSVKIVKEADWREPNFDIEEVGELMSWEHII